jgi:hypothetical protein
VTQPLLLSDFFSVAIMGLLVHVLQNLHFARLAVCGRIKSRHLIPAIEWQSRVQGRLLCIPRWIQEVLADQGERGGVLEIHGCDSMRSGASGRSLPRQSVARILAKMAAASMAMIGVIRVSSDIASFPSGLPPVASV